MSALSDNIDSLDESVEVIASNVAGVKNDIASIRLNIENKVDQSTLANYAMKEDIPSVEGFATEEFVLTKIAEAELVDKDVDLSGYVTKNDLAAVESKIPSVEGLATKQELEKAISNLEHPTVDLTGYATEEWVNTQGFAKTNDIPDVSNLATKEELKEAVDSIEHPVVDLSNYTTKDYVSKTAAQQKYEVLPVDGLIVSYFDNEVRLNTQRVDPILQDVGSTGNPNIYYVTFRAFAPEGATSVIEGTSGNMDVEHSDLATDSYGRKYTTIWSAVANTSDGGTTWSKWGDLSTLDKYYGFYYNFHWYNEDTLIGIDKVRVILTNDECHDDLVPDAVARRIDDKISDVNTVITSITEQVQNIEETYVTNETLESNYVTNTTLEQNYTTTEQLEATYVTNNEVNELVTNEVNTVVNEQIETKVETVIQEKIDAGEISVNVDAINYDTW